MKIGKCIPILAAASLASAQSFGGPGDMLGKAILDFIRLNIVSAVLDCFSLLVKTVNQPPDLKYWPTLVSVNQGFTWIGGFFVVFLTYQGVRYIMAADSPTGRAMAKASVEKLLVGMILVGFNGMIWQLGVDISCALTDAFGGDISGLAGQLNGSLLEKMVGLLGASLICFFMPLILLFLLLFLVMAAARSLILILTYAFFPMILAFHFSGVPMLNRLGSRGVNLYIAALLAYPAMSLIFYVSADMMVKALNMPLTGYSSDQLLVLNLALIGFLVGALSPLAMLGLTQNLSSIVSKVGTVAAAAAGGAAGAAAVGVGGRLVTSAGVGSQEAARDISSGLGGNMKPDIAEAGRIGEENLRKKAARVASCGDWDATTREGKLDFMLNVLTQDEMLRLFDDFNRDGVVRQDRRGMVQVGDGGKYVSKGTGNLGGYFECELPSGKGYGDRVSREVAEERGIISDGRVVMKNAVQGSYSAGGGHYTVTANDGGGGMFNVAVQGRTKAGESNTILTVRGGERYGSPEGVINEIRELSSKTGKSPDRVLREMYRQSQGEVKEERYVHLKEVKTKMEV